jgi:hypothetical protein
MEARLVPYRHVPAGFEMVIHLFVQEYVLAYALALNAWLRQSAPEPVTRRIATRYLDEDAATALAAKVHALLGEVDAVKEWLVACLLKTVKDNQRWRKGRELIDGVPQATSWFAAREGTDRGLSSQR